MPSNKDKNISMKMSVDMYDELQKLRKTLKQQNDSKTIRFCITFTLATIERLDDKAITAALAIAFGETFFNGK